MDITGCLATYSTLAGNCSVQFPEEGEVLAPWVQITFTDLQGVSNGSNITVSNRSSTSTTPPNEAVIKSFEFGYSDGITVRMVIHDQQGGSFERFMQNLLKDWACLKGGNPATVLMQFQFGWVKSGCSNPFPPNASLPYYTICDSVESNFTEGKFIFEIMGHDICHRMFEGGAEDNLGGEGQNAIFVTDAITQMMTQSVAPNVSQVSFKRVDGGLVVDSNQEGIELFKGVTEEERKKGPLGKWAASGDNKLEVARDWLRRCPALDGRSWVPQYNPMVPGGELIFWVDPRPKSTQGDNYWDANCIGTFIVNAGKYSSVLEFNPKIRWDFTALTNVGGNLGGERINAMQTDGSKNPGLDIPNLDRQNQAGAGHRTQTAVSDDMKDREGANATKEMAKNDAEAKRAMKLLFDQIEADLVIVGNPTIAPPNESILSKNVSIILINPLYLTNPVATTTSSAEWLADPPCNSVLSNKAWVCKSLTHRIEAGVYTTTIGVMLAAPGIDLPPNSPLGGWSGGWTPPVQC